MLPNQLTMYKKISSFIIIMFFLSKIYAQENTFFLGHSLVNFNLPNMVNKLSIAGGKTFDYKLNIGNGAGLQMHWTNPHSAGSQAHWWDTTLNKGGFDNFILTEAVPLKGHLIWNNTYRLADSFYRFAKQYNPNIKVYLYETWHCINSGLPLGCDWDDDDTIAWRNRLSLDLPLWEGIADSVNLLHTDDMLIIPAGQAMARLYDSIIGGNVPGITTLQQLYSDDIHLLNLGNYYIACLMYGIIHEESPLGLPNQLTDEWGTPYVSFPTTNQAQVFQRLAWQTICAYQRDGVSCSPSSVNKLVEKNYKIFPNPSNGKINIQVKTPSSISIYNCLGATVFESKNELSCAINLSQRGIYFIKIKNEKGIFAEKIVVE